MSKAKQQDNVVVEYADLTGLLPWITQMAFFLSLGLVVARCIMMETLRDPTPVAPGSSPSPAGPGPATTLWLNLLCCVPAILVLLRRAIDKTYYLHWSLAHIVMGLVAVWAVASTAWASDKYAAFINSSTVFAAGAILWSTTQLVRSWTRLRLVAGACFGVMLICTAQGLIYHFVDHPDLVKQWNETRDEVLRARGWAPDSFSAKQFELKVINGEILTFFASPNTLAALLVFTGIIAAGLAIQRISSRDEHGWAGTILPTLIPVLFVVYLTRSKTAFVTPVLAAILLFAIPRLRSWMLMHRRMVFGGAIALFGLAIVAIAGHGIYHHGLPTDSLNFRWRFWTGSFGVFEERPIIGTGWSNFGLSYLAHRLPEASEEIKDPHNFIVRFFCELGVVGGVLSLMLLFRGAWEATLPSVPPGPSGKIRAGKGLRESMGQILPIVAFAMLINTFTTIDFMQNGYWVFLELMRRLLWTGLLILALALATLKSSKESTLDDRPAPWVLYGILVALLIFLLHNLVDFSLFENGPMLLTSLLIGTVLGVRNAMSFGSRERSKVAIVTVSLALIAWVMVAIVFAVPITQAESRVREADNDVHQNNLRMAAERYKASFDELLIKNSDYAFKAAEQYALSPDNEGSFTTMIALAIASNPKDSQAYRYRAGYYLQRGEAMNKATQIDKDFKSTLTLDPNNVQARLEYADFLKSSFESQEAARQYDLALDYDNKLDAAEPKRLSAEQKEEIRKKLREIRGE